jgi:hypothetical protein
MVICVSKEKDLLDDLYEAVGCTYLSDLRLRSNHKRVVQALAQLSPQDYTPAQWQEAVRYLLA